MRISALTVSVNYTDMLQHALPTWTSGVDLLLVVTAPHDLEVQGLCNHHDVPFFVTEAFYAFGAIFNKAAAICEAIERHDGINDFWRDWCLFLDSDILLPDNWRQVIGAANPKPGFLYGSPRFLENGQWFEEYELASYFQLFHRSDKNAQRRPLLETNWRHAGGYDSEFQSRWKLEEKIMLPMQLIHQGQPGRNWWGRGNDEATDKMLSERKRIQGIGEDERIK